jgi:hypothetical protein
LRTGSELGLVADPAGANPRHVAAKFAHLDVDRGRAILGSGNHAGQACQGRGGMSRKLKKLRITEVSAVDVGARSGVRIIFCKRADGTTREIVLSAALPSSEEITKMDKPKAVIKRAASHGDVDQGVLMEAVQKRADKEVDLPERRFAKYCEQNPEVFQVLKAAPPAPAPAAPRSSYEALARGAAEHCAKMGTVLPQSSPYANFLKTNDIDGSRDAQNTQIEEQVPKTIKALAQSLVDAGKFSSIANAVLYMRHSERYAHHFRIPGLFAEGRADMLSSTRLR